MNDVCHSYSSFYPAMEFPTLLVIGLSSICQLKQWHTFLKINCSFLCVTQANSNDPRCLWLRTHNDLWIIHVLRSGRYFGVQHSSMLNGFDTLLPVGLFCLLFLQQQKWLSNCLSYNLLPWNDAEKGKKTFPVKLMSMPMSHIIIVKMEL